MIRLRRVLVASGVVLAVGLVVIMTLTAEPFEPDGFGPGQDARAYWAVPLNDPYAPGSVGQESAYLYSPAFLEVLAPIRLLSWPVFLAVWTSLLLLVLRWLSGPLLFGPLIVLTFPELWGGNITILLAAMIVVGFRRPGVWAFALLTKVTPALGLLWFAVRREWRALVEVGCRDRGHRGRLAAHRTPAVAGVDRPAAYRARAPARCPGSVPIPLLLRLPVGGDRHHVGGARRSAMGAAHRRAARHARHLVGQLRAADRVRGPAA